MKRRAIPPDEFAAAFIAWKCSGDMFLRDPYFGKDGPYARPLRDNKVVLWHAHLRPENNPAEVLEWDNRTRQGKLKTSDAVLIYTHSHQHGYLLLHAVWDVGAHDFAEMRTPAATQLMNNFANIAQEFIFWGTVAI